MSAQANEKKKLLKRLRGFCAAIGSNIETLDPALRERIDGGIERLSTVKKVAIAGLSDSGHYELAEFFLGAELGTANLIQKASPIIHVRHGAANRTRALFGETKRSFDGIAFEEILDVGEPDRLELELSAPILADIGFTIMPAYDAEENRASYLFELLNDVDVLIWCSNATEQWHSRERRFWFTIPDELKTRSILALTNADNVDSDALRAEFDKKCQYVSDEFHVLCPIATDAAKEAAPQGNLLDAELFAASGGQEILTNLMGLLSSTDTALLEDIRALRVELDAIPLGGVEAVAADTAMAPLSATLGESTASKPASKREETKADIAATEPAEDIAIKSLLEKHAKACIAAVEGSDGKDYRGLFSEIEALMKDLKTFVESNDDLQDQKTISAQLEEADDLIGLLSYETDAKAAKDGADIVRQICVDIWKSSASSAVADRQVEQSIKKAS